MKYGTLIAILALRGTALAQPGAEGMPAPMPPPVDSMQQPPPQQPQQPQAQTRATFVSTTGMKWDITIDQRPACTTPCTVPVLPLQFVAFHSHEVNPVRLDVGYLPPGDLMVTGKPLENGKYAAGVTFTTLSGMGVVTGITLAAIGCTTDHPGLCKAGIYTGIPSAIGLYASIWLMRQALPKATIGPASPYVAGNQVGLAGHF